MDQPVPVDPGDVDPASTPQIGGSERPDRPSPHRGPARAAVHPAVPAAHFSCQTAHHGAPRSHRHRRGRRRPLSDQAPGRSRDRRDRPRSRRRPRRHVVLEPLSRRALRFGELHLRLLLLARASRGMGLEGALLRPAREPALPQPRRRQVRPAPAHAVQLQGRCGALRRGAEPVAPQPRRRARAHLPLPHHGDGPAVDPHPAPPERAWTASRAARSTPTTGRTSRSSWPASGSP